MIGSRSVLAVVPARGGSKRLPGKNLRALCGQPLIGWTFAAGRRSRYIDRLILSSDDAAIIDVARRYGCETPFVRPKELAEDDSPTVDAVLHAMESVAEKYDYVVLLQPTSPLRTADDVDRCIEVCDSQDAQACVTVSRLGKPIAFHYLIDKGGMPLCRLDAIPDLASGLDAGALPCVLNGAVYVVRADFLLRERRFLDAGMRMVTMPPERSVDIDTELDLALADLLLRQRQGGM